MPRCSSTDSSLAYAAGNAAAMRRRRRRRLVRCERRARDIAAGSPGTFAGSVGVSPPHDRDRDRSHRSRVSRHTASLQERPIATVGGRRHDQLWRCEHPASQVPRGRRTSVAKKVKPGGTTCSGFIPSRGMGQGGHGGLFVSSMSSELNPGSCCLVDDGDGSIAREKEGKTK